MNYYRCKCGRMESWSSYGPARCFLCPECNTTLAGSPEGHLTEPEPHPGAAMPKPIPILAHQNAIAVLDYVKGKVTIIHDLPDGTDPNVFLWARYPDMQAVEWMSTSGTYRPMVVEVIAAADFPAPATPSSPMAATMSERDDAQFAASAGGEADAPVTPANNDVDDANGQRFLSYLSGQFTSGTYQNHPNPTNQ
jgi:hypothetical protein